MQEQISTSARDCAGDRGSSCFLVQIKRMRVWVIQAEQVLDGSWAQIPEELSTEGVSCRFAAWLRQLETYVSGEECDPVEQQCLGHLLKVMQALRPWLLHCYDIEGLPRTNNEMELLIRAIKTRYRLLVGGKTGIATCCAMAGVCPTTNGGCISQEACSNSNADAACP